MAKRHKIYPICWPGAICSLSETCFHILFQYLLLSTGCVKTFVEPRRNLAHSLGVVWTVRCCCWRSPTEALESPVKREGFLYFTRQECYYLHNWWNAASGSFLRLCLPFHFMTWQFNSTLQSIFLFIHSLDPAFAARLWLLSPLLLYLKLTGGSIVWYCYPVFWRIFFSPCKAADSKLIHSQ